MMTSSGFDAGIKLRPFPDELEELGSEFQTQWSKYYANAPDKAIAWLGLISGYVLYFWTFVTSRNCTTCSAILATSQPCLLGTISALRVLPCVDFPNKW
jgi:hypothetical protein